MQLDQLSTLQCLIFDNCTQLLTGVPPAVFIETTECWCGTISTSSVPFLVSNQQLQVLSASALVRGFVLFLYFVINCCYCVTV